jgi:N-acetylmuramic acid 6-phosphate etherase
MSTEDIDPRFLDLDRLSPVDQVRLLHAGQGEAIAAVERALPAIAAATEAAALRLSGAGRIVYCGAGTSARIGVQDGAELLPTFNWPAERVAFVIAGGEAALLRAVENAEDSADDGILGIAALAVNADDVVLGIAASGATQFTVAALQAARQRGALTIGIANNAGSPLLASVDHPVLIETGAEAIAGSTRLKAGTAQKIALNLFSTSVMVQLGHVYRGLMVDMRPTNAKLRRRAVEMVAHITSCDLEAAHRALSLADWDVKLAVLVLKGLTLEEARNLIVQSGGKLRAALGQ